MFSKTDRTLMAMMFRRGMVTEISGTYTEDYIEYSWASASTRLTSSALSPTSPERFLIGTRTSPATRWTKSWIRSKPAAMICTQSGSAFATEGR